MDRVRVQGKTPQEAVDMGSAKTNHIPVSGYVNGEWVSFSSLSEAANVYGVCPSKVAKYMKSGKTLEEALTNKNIVQVVFNDKKLQFENLVAACLYFGLEHHTVSQRIHRGWALEEALEIKKCSRKIGGKKVEISFEFNGKKYHFDSVTNTAKHFHKDPRKVYARYQKGWLIEEALDLIPRKTTLNNKKSYKIYVLTNTTNGLCYVGQTCLELEERLADHIRASRNQRSGTRKIELAIAKYGPEYFKIKLIKLCGSQHAANINETKYIEKLNAYHPNGYNMTFGGSGVVTGTRIVIEGHLFESYKAAAEYYGVNVNVLSRRIATGKWTPEQAVNIEESDNRGSVRFFQGNRFDSEKEMTRHYGVKQETYRRRIKEGQSREEALGVKKVIQTEKTKANPKLHYDHHGNAFKSLTKMAKHHSMNKATFLSRLKSGVSIEEAL